MAGVYVHIPFCRRKCFYCDFYSVGSRNAPWQGLCAALVNEAAARAKKWEAAAKARPCPATLYIGGGTPSLMPVDLFADLITGLRNALCLGRLSEFTVELNPEDVCPQLVAALADAGVNRVSMGVQSFVDAELQFIGRRHSAERALEAFRLLSARFDNVSLDLMFGLPGQDLKSWQYSVDMAVNLHPAHLSAYSLMWEERTALSSMRRQGKVDECDQELSVRMFEALSSMLAEAGYVQYEISNYCLPGRESVHNSSYWSGAPYLGIGPGAHSYDGERTRRANPADVKAYIGHFCGGEHTPFYTQEVLTDEELREEYIMTRLRRRRGIGLDDYARRFGPEAMSRLYVRAKAQPGLLHIEDGRIVLSHEGIMRSDSAILALI